MAGPDLVREDLVDQRLPHRHVQALGGEQGPGGVQDARAVVEGVGAEPAAGQVLVETEAIGVGTSWVGQRVWAFTGTGGGYVERAVAPAGDVLPLPAGLSAVDAVTLGSSGVVACFGLAHARFALGEPVLVRGAAGSTGTMTVQLAARAGAGAVTTSSAERGERSRALGATQVLDRSGAGGGGFDVIIDVVAGADMPSFFGKLNPNGRR